MNIEDIEELVPNYRELEEELSKYSKKTLSKKLDIFNRKAISAIQQKAFDVFYPILDKTTVIEYMLEKLKKQGDRYPRQT